MTRVTEEFLIFVNYFILIRRNDSDMTPGAAERGIKILSGRYLVLQSSASNPTVESEH